MSEQPSPEQHRDYYPHDSSQVLEWHERRHEAVHEILTKAGIKGSLTLLVEERVQRLACLHLEAVAKVQRLTSELNALLARAEKAEAALESAQKMCDHWEKKAAERQGQVCEWKARAEKAKAELSRFMNMPSCSPELFLRSAQRTEKTAPIDWERVRIDAAMLILRLLPSNSVGDGIIEEVTKGAVKWADALVAELQKKEVQG